MRQVKEKNTAFGERHAAQDLFTGDHKLNITY